MSDALRLCVLFWLIGSVLTLGHARAADVGRVADPIGECGSSAAAERDLGPGIDAFLEPWRRVRVAHLIPDHGRACVPVAAGQPDAAAQGELATALEVLAQSALGAWLIAQASSRRVIVCQDPNTRLAAYYRGQMRLVGVLARLSKPAKIVFLAHELAHVPQHPQFANDRRFGPRAMLLIHRVREATAEAVATRVLWQLHERGDHDPWRDKLRGGYADIAHAFASAMGHGHGEPAELLATRAALDQWFERPQRRHQYDDHMLDHLERIARDHRGLSPPTRSLSDDFLRGIGWHAGTTFLAAASGRPLTDDDYAGDLSADNAARLDALLSRVSSPVARGAGDRRSR